MHATRLSPCFQYVVGLVALCAAGCGSGGSTPKHPTHADQGTQVPDGGTAAPDLLSDPGTGYQTPFPPTFPQVLAGSGTVLAAPIVVPVFFQNDPLQAGMVTFLQNYVGRSMAWTVLQQYGVGRGTVATPVVLTQSPAPSITDADVQSLIATSIKGGGLPAPQDGIVYALYFQTNVTINFSGAVSCQDFGGYHNTARLPDGSTIVYYVVPRCSRASLVALTAASSHELAEAATDPRLATNKQLDAPYGLWLADLFGSEIGDLCQNVGDSTLNESGVGVLSRVWSNSAAMARKNPCQPAPAGPAFFSVPILTELPRVNIEQVVQGIESVSVARGQSRTIEVRLFSDGGAGTSWSVAADEVPLTDQTGALNPAVLTLTWQEAPGRPQAPGQDGTVLHLKIAVDAGAALGYTTVRLTSTGPTTSGTQTQTLWVATVRIQD